MPEIKTYYVIHQDGSRSGPFTLKGLYLLRQRDRLSEGDAVWSESEQPDPVDAADFLKQREQTVGRKKASLPPVRRSTKTKLPPLKEKPVAGKGRDEDNFDRAPVVEPVRVQAPAGLATLLAVVLSMAAILLAVHIYLTSQLASTAVFDNDVFSKLQEFQITWRMLSLFVYSLLVIGMVVYLCWLARAASNAADLTRGRFSVPPVNMVLNYFIPVYNLFAVYSQMVKLKNASLDPARYHGGFSFFVLLWWVSCWIPVYLLLSRSDEDVEVVDQLQAYFNQAIYTDIIGVFALVMTVALVFVITSAQRSEA